MPSSCPATKENSLPVHAKELHLTVNITITITLTSCGGTRPYSISTQILTYPALLTNHGTQKTQNTTRLVNILPATALWRLYHFIRFSNEISRQVVLQETMESRIFLAHAKRQNKNPVTLSLPLRHFGPREISRRASLFQRLCDNSSDDFTVQYWCKSVRLGVDEMMNDLV